jgi:hypothetical protein
VQGGDVLADRSIGSGASPASVRNGLENKAPGAKTRAVIVAACVAGLDADLPAAVGRIEAILGKQLAGWPEFVAGLDAGPPISAAEGRENVGIVV